MNPLEIVITAIDKASSVLQGVSSSLSSVGSDSSSFMSRVGSAADGLVTSFEYVAGAATAAAAAVAPILIATMDTQEATERLNTTTQDSIESANAAANGQGTLGDMLSYQTTQTALAKDALDKLTASSKSNSDQVDAAEMKYDLSAAKLQVLQGRMDDVGKSASQLSQAQQTIIDTGVKLGFTVDDTTNALNVLQPMMGSKLAGSALTAAENLSRMSNGTLDLTSAARLLGTAMETGMGRGLAQYGIIVKDGVGGTDLLTAAMQTSQGQASAYASTLGGSLAIAWATINKDMSDAGNTYMPLASAAVNLFTNSVLPALIKGLTDTITNVETLYKDFVAWFAALDKNTGIITLFKTEWQAISKQFETELLPALQKLWVALTPLKPYLEALGVVIGATLVGAIVLLSQGLTVAVGIFTGLLTAATQIATFFTNVLVGAINLVEAALEKLISSFQAIGKFGGSVGGAIGGAFNAVGGAAASLFKPFAQGGIVNGPTFALIGEAGPEAVIPLSAFNNGLSLAGAGGSGGGGVNITITGNTISNQLDLRNLAQVVGAEIVRSLRVNQKLSI